MPSGQVPPGTQGSNPAFSLRLVDVGAGRAESLVAGALVSLTVRGRLGPELYSVSLGSRLFSASSSTALVIGSVLKARVERSGGAVLLRLAASERGQSSAATLAGAERAALSAQKTAALFSAAGLPNDAAGRIALAALLGAGLAPEARALSRVRLAALRGEREGREAEYAELAARMEEKGMAAEGGEFEELAALGDGRSGGRSGDRAGSGGRERRDGRSREGAGDRARASEGAELSGDRARTAGGDRAGGQAAERSEALSPLCPDADLSRDFSLELDEAELISGLADLVMRIVSRVEKAGTEPAAPRLGLFNHLAGKDGGWVLAPFRFSLNEVDFAGSFRIRLPYIRGGEGCFEAYFTASRGASSEDWSFFVSFGGSRPPALRLVGPRPSALLRSREGELAAALAASSCSLLVEEGRAGGEGKLDIGGFDADV